MLVSSIERRPDTILARSNKVGSLSSNLAVARACMGMASVSVCANYVTAPATGPTVEFGMDGLNWAPAITLTALAGSNSKTFDQTFAIHAWKFVRVTLIAGGGGGSNVQANVTLNPMPGMVAG